ncbi:bromodomain-containing protein DDB_G0280777 [Calliphora vicina]|uniref:bromodomain-containing protein DDB_G0280777 n=1 Tax=Calliphora vicina TaxID=7373 RepID=UPI00325A928B
MGVERNIIDTNKINKSNPGDLYRPPALRNHANETIKRNVAESCELNSNDTSNISTNETSSLSSSTAASSITTTTTSISCNNSPIHRNENVNINNITTSTTETSIYKQQQQHEQVEEQQKQPQRQQLQQQTRRERRPDRAVYIPRARRSQTTPPNTTTTQIQQQPPPSPPQIQQTALSTQLLVLAPITTSDTSKSLSQQLAITLDDTTTASVNQKPSSKADEVGKIDISGGVVSTCSNISTTITKKKEKLSKENKESREQRREQRLLRKLLSTSTTQQRSQSHISKNNENLNENSINTTTISNNDGDESTNQAVIVNAQQIHSSSEINDVNNLSEFNDNNIIINLSKSFSCDSGEEFKLNRDLNNSLVQQQQQSSVKSVTYSELESFKDHQINNFAIVDNSILNESESQFLYKPVLNQSVDINCETTTNSNSTGNNITTTNIIIQNSNNNNNTMPRPSSKTKSNKLNSEVFNNTNLPNLRIEDIASQQSPTKCDIEEQELQRASKEINRSNRRIIKQTFISDVLQIPDHINEEENEDKSKVSKVNNKLASNTSRTTTQSFDSNTEEDEEEDDWENMYNDSGDCLDPKIMQELTASVGKCKIELPKMDYTAYLTKQSILNEEEFPHVLEVSNFPVEFKNQDLLMVFSQYKESGFDIKWVDDTHALAVFSSSRIAAEVLTMGHPFVVLKPLAEATVESRLKAKKCAASLQPYRPRPETCAALARRLVTGALGVRLKTAAAERENEKRVLREAKERKLLAAKQRDEVWES